MPPIDISWADRKLEKACATDGAGARRWGAEHWKILKSRLGSLRAAPTLAEMSGVPGNCHALTGDRARRFAVHLWGPYRLVFEPDQDPSSIRSSAGSIDRASVVAIRITEVVDYHGD